MSAALRIGIVGYGRFGAALASLLEERGHAWRGWDPAVRIGGDHGVADVDTLLSQSDLIIVAVPVSAFEGVLRGLRPKLSPRHMVMDVCSVKQGPCQLMDEVLGAGNRPRRLPPAVWPAQHRPGGAAANRAVPESLASRRRSRGARLVRVDRQRSE